MYCEKCGQQIPDDSKFCEFCGAPVKVEVKPKVTEPVLPIKETVIKKVKPKQTIKKTAKPKLKSKLIPIILVTLIAVGGYFALNYLGMDEWLAKLPDWITGKRDTTIEPTREDFSWYVPMSYDEVPQGGFELMYKDILGEWKVMVVNYVSDPEETYFSTVGLKEISSSGNNTSLEFTHHYIEYDGEKYPFEGDEAKDLLYGNYSDGYLTFALGDEEVAEIIFWSKDNHEYGQSHIYSDWDKDGLADLVKVLLFTR